MATAPGPGSKTGPSTCHRPPGRFFLVSSTRNCLLYPARNRHLQATTIREGNGTFTILPMPFLARLASRYTLTFQPDQDEENRRWTADQSEETGI